MSQKFEEEFRRFLASGQREPKKEDPLEEKILPASLQDVRDYYTRGIYERQERLKKEVLPLVPALEAQLQQLEVGNILQGLGSTLFKGEFIILPFSEVGSRKHHTETSYSQGSRWGDVQGYYGDASSSDKAYYQTSFIYGNALVDLDTSLGWVITAGLEGVYPHVKPAPAGESPKDEYGQILWDTIVTSGQTNKNVRDLDDRKKMVFQRYVLLQGSIVRSQYIFPDNFRPRAMTESAQRQSYDPNNPTQSRNFVKSSLFQEGAKFKGWMKG